METAYGHNFESAGLTSPVLIARYTKRFRHFFSYVMIWGLFAGVAYLFLYSGMMERHAMTESVAEFLEKERKGLMILAGVILGALILDVLLVVLVLLSGKPALRIDQAGVHGFTGGVWRSIKWDLVQSIESGPVHVTFARAPRNKFEAYIKRVNAARGGKFLGHYEIIIPIHRIDKSEYEIHQMVEMYRPSLMQSAWQV